MSKQEKYFGVTSGSHYNLEDIYVCNIHESASLSSRSQWVVVVLPLLSAIIHNRFDHLQ